jgi:hypothetical protein
MECREFQNYAERWLEGERHAEAEAHAAACAACGALIADLEAIRAEASSWAGEETDAPARVWTALRAQLEDEGLIRAEEEAGGLARLFPTELRPALAGAYLALLLVAAGLVGWESDFGTSRGMQLAGAPPEAASVENELNLAGKRVVRGFGQQDTMVMASYRQSLAIVDKFIALCEKSVRENPNSDLAREYLYGAYQQKAELLAAMLERGVTSE